MNEKEKQIDEMAVILSPLCDEEDEASCKACNEKDKERCGECIYRERAEALYAAGYRKQSEVAKEVLDKVYKAVEQVRLDCEFQNEKGEWLMDEGDFLAEFTFGALREIYAEYGIDIFKRKEE